MNIFVVRHGITEWNLQRRAQGREDIPLNEGGILQARDCGEKLQGLPIDHMVSSPLSRAKRTAEIIGGYLGIHQVEVMEAFTERDFGFISGATQEEIQAQRDNGAELGMESRRAVRERAMKGLQELQECYGESNTMIVTHGGLIRNLLRQCMKEEEIPNFFENCGICMLTYREGQLETKLINLKAEAFMEAYLQL